LVAPAVVAKMIEAPSGEYDPVCSTLTLDA
jgi:hypothetical protein